MEGGEGRKGGRGEGLKEGRGGKEEVKREGQRGEEEVGNFVPICLLVAYLTLMTLLLWCDSVCTSCTLLGSTTTIVLWQP